MIVGVEGHHAPVQDWFNMPREQTVCQLALLSRCICLSFGHFGILTSSRGTSSIGMRLKRCDMQLSRAALLSSERMMYQGAWGVSVARSISSRARVVVPSAPGLDIHRTQLPLPQRIIGSRLKSASLLVLAHLEPVFDQRQSAFDHDLLNEGDHFEEPMVLLFGAEAHDAFNAGTVIPAAIENDDLTSRGEMRDIAGAGRATTRKTLGLTRSVIAFMVPPLPAASRPPKTTTTRSPLNLTQSCSLHSRLAGAAAFRCRLCASSDPYSGEMTKRRSLCLLPRPQELKQQRKKQE